MERNECNEPCSRVRRRPRREQFCKKKEDNECVNQVAKQAVQCTAQSHARTNPHWNMCSSSPVDVT